MQIINTTYIYNIFASLFLFVCLFVWFWTWTCFFLFCLFISCAFSLLLISITCNLLLNLLRWFVVAKSLAAATTATAAVVVVVVVRVQFKSYEMLQSNWIERKCHSNTYIYIYLFENLAHSLLLSSSSLWLSRCVWINGSTTFYTQQNTHTHIQCH